jgi:2-dehydro-3-deoxy-D-arabinonate dehydratase
LPEPCRRIKLKLCTFKVSGSTHLGVYDDHYILDLTVADNSGFKDFRSLIRQAKTRNSSLDQLIEPVLSKARRLTHDKVTLTLPFMPSEIWGAGVTYTRSMEARKRETGYGEIYDHVYSAPRPELFLKDSRGRRCVGPNEFIRVRSDSRWTVPEPELGLVLDSDGKIAGYTIANDVSARDIEGENPLYLPQAKIYKGSCSFGPVVVTPDEIRDPRSLGIHLTISRGGRTMFEGKENTSAMKRSLDELVSYLENDNVLGELTLLMTGTGIVPPDDFALADGDLVEIAIDGIGVLRNPVRKL